jgi:hypothetical protein
MKKTFASVLVAGVIGITISGCAGNSVPINTYVPPKEALTLNDSKFKGVVNNGAIILNDGKKIFDEEGDILTTFEINNELFYILKSLVKDDSHFKIKNSSKTVIAELKANSISWFIDDNKFALATKLEKNSNSSIYDNVYEFDGKKLNLVNKNLDLSEGVYTTRGGTSYSKKLFKSGLFIVESHIAHRDDLFPFKSQYLINVITGDKIDMSAIKTNYKSNNLVVVLGVRNNILYYAYSTGSMFDNTTVTEALDLKVNKAYTLFKDDNYVQLLESGNQIAFKIFDKNPKIKSESIIFLHEKEVVSEYRNEPAKIISLNSLKEFKDISNSFKIVPMHSSYSNLAGGNTSYTMITYTISSSRFAMGKTGKPLF